MAEKGTLRESATARRVDQTSEVRTLVGVMREGIEELRAGIAGQRLSSLCSFAVAISTVFLAVTTFMLTEDNKVAESRAERYQGQIDELTKMFGQALEVAGQNQAIELQKAERELARLKRELQIELKVPGIDPIRVEQGSTFNFPRRFDDSVQFTVKNPTGLEFQDLRFLLSFPAEEQVLCPVATIGLLKEQVALELDLFRCKGSELLFASPSPLARVEIL